MSANTLLLLSSSTLRRPAVLRSHLTATGGSWTSSKLTGSLYIQCWSWDQNKSACGSNKETISFLSQVSRSIYAEASVACPWADVRFILKPWSSVNKLTLTQKIQKVFVDPELHQSTDQQFSSLVAEKIAFIEEGTVAVEVLDAVNPLENAEQAPEDVKDAADFNEVALGGTFDRIHNGHKILLTEAVLRCSRRLTVGVTDETMIKSKTLHELIEPLNIRIKCVTELLQDIQTFRPNQLSYNVVPISDPFGPTITEEQMDLIIVSEETIRGGTKINEIRASKNFKPMLIHSIQLSQDPHKQSQHEDDKISSSSKRLRLLGERLRHPIRTPSVPYIIGLTGGIACGKSTLSAYLTETYHAPIVNCDLLGHKAYELGAACYPKIIETFGPDVVAESGAGINRRALGAKVFGKPEELKKLTDIVWPEIRRLSQVQIEEHAEKGAEVIIIDAAVLLEAGWNDFCHEVWVVFVPTAEAIKRVQERDGLSAEDAQRRISSQLSNSERLSHATFAFCSAWEKEFTRSQVHKAWDSITSVINELRTTE